MNTRTSIARQPSNDKTEQVALIAGEASFSISSRDGYRLAVHATAGSIVAQNARFDVRYTAGQPAPTVCATCLDGEIHIRRGRDETRVKSGEQVSFGADGLSQVVAIDSDIVSAWQRGVLIFRATPLSEVVDEVNRYRPGRIVIANSSLSHIPVSGQFRIDHLDEFLAQASQAFGAQVRMLPGGLVLLS
jgi:transmembrane sensor